LSKYVDEAFEPLVYVREPDDADEYNFFAGSRFKQLGASEAAEKAVNEMGIERPSHIQALTYGWLSGEKDASGPDEAEAEFEAEASASVETSAGDPVASPTASPGALLMADQAGSGKTLAYLLPLLQRLQAVERTAGRAAPNRPRLLVLCPTSELVVQVLGVARALARGGLRCRSLAMTGGNESETQTRA
jgi:Superfamily II DNA and RNA helicases